MFCTVVVVCPAGSKVSGSMPTAIENVESAPPLAPLSDDGASGSLTLHAVIRTTRDASAARALTRGVRRRGAVVFIGSRSDEGAHNWTGSGGWDGLGDDAAGRGGFMRPPAGPRRSGRRWGGRARSGRRARAPPP